MQPRSRHAYLAGTTLVLLLICTACSSASATTSPPPTQSSQPTSAAQSAATSIPATGGSTRLGSNISAFVGKYGQPNKHSTISQGQYHFQAYPGENTDFLILWTDQTDGGAYRQHVYNVDVQAPTAGWSTTQANTLCKQFYPSDANYQREAQLSAGGGYDKIYVSLSLARLFPAAAFRDAQTNPTRAGTFDVQFLTRSDGGIDSCSIQIGAEQAQ